MTDSFTCPICGKTSYHPKDISQRYCNACHRFVDDLTYEQAIAQLEKQDRIQKRKETT